MICSECGIEPSDPDAHEEMHARIAVLRYKAAGEVEHRPVSSQDARERTESGEAGEVG